MSDNPQPPNLGERARAAGQQIIAAPPNDVGATLADQLQQFIGQPYRIETGFIADADGNQVGPFGALICTGGQPIPAQAAVPVVPTEAVAVAIDVLHTLDLATLDAAYSRIAAAKAMKKTTPPPGHKHVEPTLGIIFAVDSNVSLDELANEVRRLNETKHSDHWVDIVAVAAKGKICLTLQFVGSAKINGTLLPTTPGAAAGGIVAFYALLVIATTGADTFNSTLDTVTAQLSRWSNGYVTPDYASLMTGVSKQCITITGYMPDLSGQFLPAPQEHYQGRKLPARQVLFFSQGQNEPLGAMSFMKWLDGGVIMLRGKLPLEGMLIFLGGIIDKTALKFRKQVQDDLQVSAVLPINEGHYRTLLHRIQRQSNFVVKPDAGKFVFQKLADEGSSSPFMARVCIAPLKLTETFDEKEAFSDAYQSLMTTLLEIRDMAKEIATLWGDYARKVEEGSIVRVDAAGIHISEYIDKPLGRRVNELLSAATRSFKDRMQRVTTSLKVNIGCLYQKDQAFEKGLADLEKVDAPLATYLREARVWGAALVDARNGLDHGGWRLQSSPIQEAGGKVTVAEPVINDVPVTQWVAAMVDRVACFVEDVTIHCIQQRLPAGVTLMEIPIANRAAEMPVRFQPTPIGGGALVWKIQYHASKLEET